MAETSMSTEEGEMLEEDTAGNRKSCLIPLHLYCKSVKRNVYYEERKREQHILYRFLCIPLAFLYWFFIVWVFSEFILNTTDTITKFNTTEKKDIPRNICEVILSAEKANFSDRIPKPVITKPAEISMSSFGNVSQNLFLDIPLHNNNGDNSSHVYWSMKNDALVNVTFSSSYKVKPEGPLYFPDKYIREHSSRNFKDETKGNILFKNDSPELLFFTGTFMAIIGITSIFSRSTQGTMLLILPGLVTRHSRKIVFTFILGLLANGPMNTLKYNFNRVIDNTACMYKSVTVAACIKQNDYNQMVHYGKDLYNTWFEMNQHMKKMGCKYSYNPSCDEPTKTSSPFDQKNTKWDSLLSVGSPSLAGIKLQAALVIDKMYIFRSFFDILRKCLTIVSIMFLIYDAVRYLRSYYTSFDNMYISASIKKTWKRTKNETLTPLRHWEINNGYQEKWCSKFTRKDCYKILRDCLPTFIFFLFVASVFVVDCMLAFTLQYIKSNHQLFSIELEGDNKELAEYINKLYNQDMELCLSSPEYPSIGSYILIGLLLLSAIISCVLEVYMARIRVSICNLFYHDRAEERADYLYYKITTGRVDRRHNFYLIITRELERKTRLAKLSILKMFKRFLCRCSMFYPLRCLSNCLCPKKKKIRCPGCGWKVKLSKSKEVLFNIDAKEMKARICPDCDIDFPDPKKLSNISENGV